MTSLQERTPENLASEARLRPNAGVERTASPETAADAACQIETLTSVSECERVATEWETLAAQVPGASLFCTPGWTCAWWNAFGARKRLQVTTVRCNQRLCALIPLVRARVTRGPTLSLYHDLQPEDREFLTRRRRASVVPLLQLSVPANLESGSVRSGQLVLPPHEVGAWTALLSSLSRRDDWDLLCLPALPNESAQVVQKAAESCRLPVLVDAGPRLYRSRVMPWQEHFRARHRHFRTRFRTGEQLLAKLGQVQIRVVDEQEVSLGVMDEVFDLAQKSWKQEGRPGEACHVALTQRARAFYTELAQRRWLTAPCPIVALYVGGALVAALLCAVHDGTLFALQTFYDPRVAPVSPGARLLPALYDWCHEHGLKTIDWNGNNSWVQRFADDHLEYRHLYVLCNGVYGRLLYRLAQATREALHLRRLTQR